MNKNKFAPAPAPSPDETWLRVSIKSQQLEVIHGETCLRQFAVSTAKLGAGEQQGSEKTPRGWHSIRALIGADAPAGAVFVGRRQTGEIYSQALANEYPERDWILSRILWLTGLEQGKNRLGMVDTMRRYIYIHGTPDSELVGTPSSHGCIRMQMNEVIDLYNQCFYGMHVRIDEN